jgi:hypothetical protein
MTMLDREKHPADIDYVWYRKEAISIAVAVGCSTHLTAEELALIAPPPKVTRKRKNGTDLEQ